MTPTTIFITYNPKSQEEQTLAMRLHSIGAVSGFRMYLPDRYNSESLLDDETKLRIERSDYFVMFSTKALSNIVKQEIECSFNSLNDKSKIIVIYDKEKGKNIRGEITNHFTPFYFDRFENRQDKMLEEIINTIAHKEKNTIIGNQRSQIAKLHKEKQESKTLAAILGIGLGLLILGAISSEK